MPNSRRRIEERRVVRRQARQHFDHRVEDEVEHQRQAAAVAIRHDAEQHRTDRPHRQARGQRQRDLRARAAEVLGDRVEHHDQHEEVERIERPAEEACEQRVALIPALLAAVGIAVICDVSPRVSNPRGRSQRTMKLPRCNDRIAHGSTTHPVND